MGSVRSNQKPPADTDDSFSQTSTAQSDKAFNASEPTSTPPLTSPTPEQDSSVPGDTPQASEELPVKKDMDFLSKALLVLGPLIMVGLFTFSFYNLTKQPAEFPVQMTTEPTASSSQEKARQILLNVPKNPDQISARCLSTGEDLVSGQPTDCPDPEFSWIGEEPREPGTNIVGFYVYFGTNGNDEPITYPAPAGKFKEVVKPFYDGQFQEGNKFEPKDLQKGTTYYLAVAARSDSENPYWRTGFDVVDIEKLEARVAKILFVYKYE